LARQNVLKPNRLLLLYLGVVFLISYGLQGIIWLEGGIESDTFKLLVPVVMFIPGIAAIFFLLREKHGLRSVRWGLRKPQYLAYAAFIPAVMALGLVLILTNLGWAKSPHLDFSSGSVDILGGLFVLGKGNQSILFFLVNFLVTAIVLGIVNGLVTVGEEVGWRGYLQPRLIQRFPFAVAIILVGLIWAHWHTPVILMGYNYPETPVLGAILLWPITCIAWSFVAAFLTINSDSIWPAVVFHGSVNAFLGGLVDGMTYTGPRLPADVLVIVVWLIVAALSYFLTKIPAPIVQEVVPD